MTYLDFLRSKIELAQALGFDVSRSEINPALMPRQRDAVEVLGMEEPPYVRTMDEARQHPDSPILLTNYERVRDGDIDPVVFTAAVLDKASVLRSFGSKTY